MSSNSKQILTAAAFGALVAMQGCGTPSEPKAAPKTVDVSGQVDKVVAALETKKEEIVEKSEKVIEKVTEKVTKEVQSVVADVEIPEKFQSVLNQYEFSAEDLNKIKADIAEKKFENLEEHIAANFSDAKKVVIAQAVELLETDVVIESKEQAQEILKNFLDHGKDNLNKTTGAEVVAALSYCLDNQHQFSKDFIAQITKKAASFQSFFGHGDGSKFLCNKTTFTPEQLEAHYAKLVEEASKVVGKDIMNKVAVKTLDHAKAVQYSHTIKNVANELFDEKNGRFFKYIGEMAKQLPVFAEKAVAEAAEDVKEAVAEVKDQVVKA